MRRRGFLTVTAAFSTALVAGCTRDGDDDGGGDGDGNGEGGDDDAESGGREGGGGLYDMAGVETD